MDKPLMINRSQNPNFEDFLELNDLNEPLEPSDDDEFSDELVEGVDDNFDLSKEINARDEIKANKDGLYYNKHEDYPSFDNVKYKIHIDHPYNLKFSYIIGFKFVDANFSPTNTIIKDKLEHKGKNVVCFINVPIFVAKFSIVTNLSSVENMDSYCDVGIDDEIYGEPFCSKVDIIARRFEGKIIIHYKEVSYWIEHAYVHEKK
ncbi:hypothetical protein Tco_0170006 [Tanacetum coccineum]